MRNIWNLTLSKALFLAFCLTRLSLVSFAQLEESHLHKDRYYLFPIKPGIRNTLAGTMGELRSSHFHTGIDIRTESRTGLMVQATADGYISRIAVSTSGYGNAIYITHPNGNISAYGHLEKFTGPLADYVRKEQYRRQTFDLNLYFRKGQFPVHQGDTIAYSGNSGSSGGPHLHFDIRDKNNQPLNPLKYGFAEIVDHTPPIARKVTIKTLNKDSRVNGQFGRIEFDLRRIGNNYIIDEPINVFGKIGVELYAYDKLDNARFHCGINKIIMHVAGKETFKQEINTLSFSDQRNVMKHMDYYELRNTGERYHKLYVDDGNGLNFYNTDANKGKLNIAKTGDYPVKITMLDSYNNLSYLNFIIKYAEQTLSHLTDAKSHNTNIQLIDNTLVIQAAITDNHSGVNVYTPEHKELKPEYAVNNTAVYLWNMADGLPYSVDINSENKVLNYKDMVIPGISYTNYNEFMDISFSKGDLFDTLYLQTNYAYDSLTKKEIFSIGDPNVPLKSYLAVTLKPQQTYEDQEKYAVYALSDNGGAYFKGGSWDYNKITFATRDFGNFTILKDSLPPKIIPIRVNGNDLRFKIYDERSGLKDFTCLINGSWVLMNYDYKTNTIWSEKLDPMEAFKGEVKLTVSDNADNIREYITNIN